MATSTSNGAGHSVAVLAYAGMSAFELGIVTEIFGVRWPGIDGPWYDLTVCVEDGSPELAGSVEMIGGARLSSPHGLAELAAADTVIVPSVSSSVVSGVEPSSRLVEALRSAHARGARVVSICTGAFALAGAGLLDGRRATTHWYYADALRERYPSVRVDPTPLFIDHGDVLTSAGSAAGIDLCLHLVSADHGAAVANLLARRLVVQPYRDGGQAQYIESAVAVQADDDRIAASMAWALEHLSEPITLQTLARQASMSVRTYVRHFAQSTGTSPIRWLTSQRIQASMALLETTNAPVEQISAAVGFETPVTFRHHFRQVMRTSPSAYRRGFRAGGRPGVAATG